MVREYLKFLTIKVVSLNFQCELHGGQLKIMGWVILLIHLQFPRHVDNHLPLLHQNMTQTQARSITKYNESTRT